MKDQKVNLLWTGGWDSTFRLLQLLIVQKKYVQPYYIIDTKRKSIVMELDAMHHIKKKLGDSFPEVINRLLDTFYINKDDFDAPEDIKSQYDEIAAHYHIGSQYLWLAAFSKVKHIHDLELSAEKTNYDGIWMGLLVPLLVKDGDGYKIDLSLDYEKKFGLFAGFRFPLLDYYKEDMEAEAKEYGFYDILTCSWFCHFPIMNKPCGVCRPCQMAMKSKHHHNYKMPNKFLRNTIKMLRFVKVKGMGLVK